MTVRDVFKTVRPVAYDNQDDSWEYSTGGSCVLLSYRGRFYAVTALHVPTGYLPSQILIPYEEGSETFLPISEAFTITTSEHADTDHKDVMFLEIWRDKLDNSLWKQDFCFNLASNDRAVTTEQSRYWFSGYPHELNGAEYDRNVLYHQATHISGQLVTRNRFIGVDEIAFDSGAELQSYQGFSGGGAFSFTPVGEGMAHVRFEGLILRATIESQKGFILQSNAIKNYIIRQQSGEQGADGNLH